MNNDRQSKLLDHAKAVRLAYESERHATTPSVQAVTEDEAARAATERKAILARMAATLGGDAA